ncbi:MAG: hypothetical protein UHN93_03925, partial [Alistipes sp.]|nr:hypothetical protein [Alistipes sp.]
ICHSERSVAESKNLLAGRAVVSGVYNEEIPRQARDDILRIIKLSALAHHTFHFSPFTFHFVIAPTERHHY